MVLQRAWCVYIMLSGRWFQILSRELRVKRKRAEVSSFEMIITGIIIIDKDCLCRVNPKQSSYGRSKLEQTGGTAKARSGEQ